MDYYQNVRTQRLIPLTDRGYHDDICCNAISVAFFDDCSISLRNSLEITSIQSTKRNRFVLQAG